MNTKYTNFAIKSPCGDIDEAYRLAGRYVYSHTKATLVDSFNYQVLSRAQQLESQKLPHIYITPKLLAAFQARQFQGPGLAWPSATAAVPAFVLHLPMPTMSIMVIPEFECKIGAVASITSKFVATDGVDVALGLANDRDYGQGDGYAIFSLVQQFRAYLFDGGKELDIEIGDIKLDLAGPSGPHKDSVGIGSAKCPHLRREHYRTLRHPKWGPKVGKVVRVSGCGVHHYSLTAQCLVNAKGETRATIVSCEELTLKV